MRKFFERFGFNWAEDSWVLGEEGDGGDIAAAFAKLAKEMLEHPRPVRALADADGRNVRGHAGCGEALARVVWPNASGLTTCDVVATGHWTWARAPGRRFGSMECWVA